ncbi:MAG: DUF1203 domain-containing protein [Dongiaceae bacterium]
MSVRYQALRTDLVRALQAGTPDANGQAPERHVSDGNGNPCRHCLKDIEAGAPMLVLAHRPFPTAQPYAELGPIFLHADSCPRHEAAAGMPAMFLQRRAYMIRGYGPDHRIVYGSGAIAAPSEMDEHAENLLGRSNIAYLHVRSGSYNCYQCRIDRVSEIDE